MRFKEGDKVRHSYLGNGIIVEIVNEAFVLVFYDKTPDIAYNMGTNPTVSFTKYLTKRPNAKPNSKANRDGDSKKL